MEGGFPLTQVLRSMFAGVFVALVLSGCLNGAEQVAPTTSSMPPPPPKVVSEMHVDACEMPVQTTSSRERFVVDEGFDQIVIDYGETGVGQVTASIRYVEENKNVWGGEQHTVNTAQSGGCGAHGSHGPGEAVDVEPGEYEANIQYTGSVDVVLSITARSSRSNDTMHSEH